MAGRPRGVVWTEAAREALDETSAYLTGDSHQGAVQVLTRVLEAAASLSTLLGRGRVLREAGDPSLRALLVYDDRLIYRVRQDVVAIRAFVHGARNFPRWRREQAPDL